MSAITNDHLCESLKVHSDREEEEGQHVRAMLMATAAERLEALEGERDRLRELLDDLWFCHGEQTAIGGGPGWRERDRKAWAAVSELYEP